MRSSVVVTAVGANDSLAVCVYVTGAVEPLVVLTAPHSAPADLG